MKSIKTENYTRQDVVKLINSIKTNNREWDAYIGKGKSPLSFEENVNETLRSIGSKTELEVEMIGGEIKYK